jgi:hypothetical protein
MKTALLFLMVALNFPVGAMEFEAPHIPGWKQDGEVKTFERDNLFNHINGASEFYFSYNFQRLWVVRYAKGEAELTLEVYDHGDSVHAFGIYSMERPPDANVKEIGAQGYYEEAILNFFAGQYYVKMNSYREPEAGSGVMLSTAREVAQNLAGNAKLPEVIEAMPAENLVLNSRQYVSNTFMGLEFLGGAFRGSYKNDEGKITMFVMERDSKEKIQNLLEKYHEFAQAEAGELSEDEYVIEDRFNGTIYLNWKGKYLIGFSGDGLQSFREELLRKTINNLASYQ